MLHVASRPIAAETMAAAEGTHVTLADLGSFFKRHALVIVATVAAFLIVAGLYLLTTAPTYVASAKLLIESQRSRPTWQEFGGDVNVDSAEVESQAEVLRSAGVAQEVISKLQLTADPEFARASESEKMRAATFALTDRLQVRRIGQSNVLEVVFSSSSPTKAAKIANELVAAYLRGGWRYNLQPENFRRFNDDLNRESLAVTNAQVITAAMPPLGKSAPKTSLILFFALASGALAGMGLALCFDKYDRRLRSLDQIGDNPGTVMLPPLPAIEPMTAPDEPPALAAIDRPFSKFSDALRATRLALERTAEGSDKNCIGFVPVVSGAGATTVAANLAALTARAGKRVLVLDADFSNPSLSRLLAPKATKGLIELLCSREEGCFTENERFGFTVLPLVNCARIANSTDLMRSAAMTALLRRARSEFDMVFVDLPPALAIADGKAAGQIFDRMVFVAEYGKTHIDELLSAIDHAGNYSNNVILNKQGDPALLSQISSARQWLEAAAFSVRSSITSAPR